jgi:hypothetical protein
MKKMNHIAPVFILSITEIASKLAIEPNSNVTANRIDSHVGFPRLKRSIRWIVDIIDDIAGTERNVPITTFLRRLLFIR